MEKKSGRTVQSSSKGLQGADSKKNQDVTGKLWPRNGRRSYPAKSETSRKPTPQKNKALDKRPRARGGYCSPYQGAPDFGKEGALKEDDEEGAFEPELGSVFNLQSRKKQSLNHLLNFHYETHQPQRGPRNTGNSRGYKWLSTRKHHYNKEQFIQANCQFIVNSSGNYSEYINNPDALVDWSLIEQVNVQVHELPSCPICLYPPVAAKMTRCGHIYCWSCVLHYLALSDKKYEKCPICYESIHKHDLKSVVPVPHSSFNTNETITFKLMKRARGSLIAYPIDEPVRDNDYIYMSEKLADKVYCKLLLATIHDIVTIIERERNELQTQLDAEDGSENCFIEQAIALLKEREAVMFNCLEISMGDMLWNLTIDEGKRERFESFCSSEMGSEDFGSKVGEDVIEEGEREAEGALVEEPATKYFYFYQAADGQHIYLHALNARMLEHTYGSLEFSPKTLTGRILEKEGGSMTEDIRKRLRYLQHMPVTCQFEMAEIQLGTPIISKETVKFFEDQVEVRKRRRQKLGREERRREKKIAEEENRQMGKFPAANIHLESPYQFPGFGQEVHVRERTVSVSTSRSTSPPSDRQEHLSTSYGCEATGPSLAMILQTTKKQTTKWPDLKTPLSTSSGASVSSARLINVTGSKPVTPMAKKQTDSEPECEDYVPAPAYNRSFSDAIAMALEKASKSDENGNNGEGKSGKKKKKNKQKVLFATSMAYSGN